MAINPTLLIGLGGIGCRVVERVFSRIPSDRRQLVLVHGFDTNINDMTERVNLGRDHMTQTSRPWTVRQYLLATDPSVREWFPDHIPELNRKSLTDGAGQIRVVSRLAYRAALEAGNLSRLEQQINELFYAAPENTSTSVRVMIVNSLAGGTGAGMFLQVAMFLRDHLKVRHGTENVRVQGAFLLPDTLISTKVLDKREWDNARANAYACLKELDAIALNARRGNGESGVTIELEFSPGQQDHRGRRDFAIPPSMAPIYDFSFLFDFENSKGENLASLENYVEQVAGTTFLRLFSPISGGVFSEEDNKIIASIENEGRNRYAGAGVAILAYPYSDIVAYCALKWSTSSLSDQWLKLDELYDEEKRAYQRDLKAGAYRDRPVLAKRFTWLLDDLAVGEKPEPLFKSLHRSAHQISDKGQVGEPKAFAFLDAVDAELKRALSADSDLTEHLEQCRLDEGLFKVRDRASGEIARLEDELDRLRDRVTRFVAETRTYLANRVVAQDCEAPGCLLGEDCRLNTWLLKKPDPMHPVAVRYTLYRIALALDERIEALAPANGQTLKAINSYTKAYDLGDTEDIVENAADRIRLALGQAIWMRAFNNHFTEFTDEYREKSARQLQRLRHHLENGLKEAVYREIRSAVAEMIADWERYFDNLREVRNSLLRETILREGEHEQRGDPTQLFVLAKSKDKQETWEVLRSRLVGDILPADISRQIFIGQYLRYCKRRASGRDKELAPEKTEEMFREDVLRWCEAQLRNQDSLNLNVVAALRREAEISGQDPDAHVRRRIGDIDRLARPFVPDVPNASTSKLIRWGVHPEASDALTTAARQELFQGKEVADMAFSPYELIRYSSIYGLNAEDLQKFSAGDSIEGVNPGVYYAAYRQRIEQLKRQGNTVTVHLDKRWHLPAYMPDLNTEQQTIEQSMIDRALILGRIHGWLTPLMEDSPPIWWHLGRNGRDVVKVQGRATLGQIHLLHNALKHNPSIVDEIIDRAAEQLRDDRTQYTDTLESYAFWKGALGSDILETIVTYPAGNPADGSLRERVEKNLLPALINEIRDLCVDAFGKARENTAKARAAELIEKLAAISKTYTTADPKGGKYVGWSEVIKRKLSELRKP